jgi:AcrR family transcriptional regulator
MGTALAERPPASTYAAPRVAAGSPGTSGTRAQLLDAVGRRVAAFGLSKTTVEDVAREARLSRATVYRLFPGGRDELVGAYVGREVAAFFGAVATELEAVGTLDDVAVRFLTATSERLVAHEPLRTVLAHEPELVLPHIAFAGLDRLLAVFGDFLESHVARGSRRSFGRHLEPEDARRAGEWLVRLGLSFVLCPAGLPERVTADALRAGRGRPGTFMLQLQPLSEEQARVLVDRFVVPGIRVLAHKPTTDPVE